MSKLDIDSLLNDPTVLFKQDDNKNEENAFSCDSLLKSLKNVVDPLIKTSKDCVLDEIYIDGLDATQVWGQVNLVFNGIEKNIWSDIEKYKSKGMYQEEDDDDTEEGAEDNDMEENNENQEDSEDSEEEDIDGINDSEEIENTEANQNDILSDKEDDEAEDSEEENSEENTISPSKDYGLNDDFFNLDDYKRQVLALEDNDNDDGDDEDIDYFAEMSDDNDDDEMYTYDDFFDSQNIKSKNTLKSKNTNKKKSDTSKKSKKELGEEDYDEAYDLAQADIYGDEHDEEEYGNSDSDEEIEEKKIDKTRKGKGKGKNSNVDDEKLSTFEKQQREIQKQIAELEAESIAEKKWTMKGEVSSKQRDTDTLLEEDLEFDRTAKPVPVITQEVTESIEDIIKRRIINQEFDEIPKRIISELNNFKPSKKVQVSEEKSSKSLAELYEDEYKGTEGKEEVNESLKAAHDEISELFKDITYQLDSLYSSHFVPKPKEKLLDVRINTSTIAMEDAQPLTMSNGKSLAPQEIYKVGTKVGKDEVVLRSGVVMAKAELDRDDKQRLHRAKKRKQHLQSKDESLKKKKVETSQL